MALLQFLLIRMYMVGSGRGRVVFIYVDPHSVAIQGSHHVATQSLPSTHLSELWTELCCRIAS